jgi:hypothetical protein
MTKLAKLSSSAEIRDVVSTNLSPSDITDHLGYNTGDNSTGHVENEKGDHSIGHLLDEKGGNSTGQLTDDTELPVS